MKYYITDDIEKQDIKVAWKRIYSLGKYARNPFLDYEDMMAWIEINKKQAQYQFECAIFTDYNRIVGIIPYAIRKYNYLIRIIYFAGSEYHDYNDILVDDGYEDVVIEKFISQLRINEMVIFRGIKKDSVLFNTLIKIRPYSLKLTTVSPYSFVSDDTCVRSSTLKDVKYNLRRLGNQGEITFSEIVGTEERKKAMKELFELHILEWNQKGQSSIFENEFTKEYYLRLLDNTEKHNYIFELRFCNKVIALVYGQLRNGTLFYYKPTYDTDYCKYSPGKLLIWHLREFWEKSGGDTIDFLVGNEQYKYDWSNMQEKVYSAIIAKCGIVNRFVSCAIVRHDKKTGKTR